MDDLKLLQQRLEHSERIWLFLDYDGTLADFAPTPAHITPDPALIDLLTRLSMHPRLRVAIVSGRCLSQLQELVPVSEVLLAGTYGIEIRPSERPVINRLAYHSIRPVLDDLKPCWAALITHRQGYYLEDKRWALALHARFAPEDEAQEVLAAAEYAANEAASKPGFRILRGHKFLEIAPVQANKGFTVSYLLENYPWAGATPLYMGDDGRDEEAFHTVNDYGGISVVVSSTPRDTCAAYRLNSPHVARCWLDELTRV